MNNLFMCVPYVKKQQESKKAYIIIYFFVVLYMVHTRKHTKNPTKRQPKYLANKFL